MTDKKNPSSYYQCAECNGSFERGWSEEEAMAESKSLFGEIPKKEQVVVCDNCFKSLVSEQRINAWKAGLPIDER